MVLLVERRLGEATGQTVQRELLSRLSTTRRELIAFSLDLSRKSSARQIAATFNDESRLREILEELSDHARRLLATAVFNVNGIALCLHSIELGPTFDFERKRQVAAREVERRGLAFAFRTPRRVFYHVPGDLRSSLRRALVKRYVRTVRPATALRWLATPRQDLNDIAALWMELARAPVPLTIDGNIQKNSKSRLLATLPVLDLPDPDGALTQNRLDFALAQLRDGGYLRFEWVERQHHGPKGRLVAADHIADAFRDDAKFERLPEWGSYQDRRVTARALVLSECLARRSVGIASFAVALETLLSDSGESTHKMFTPTELVLSGLLPSWLRGELQLGLTRGKLVAIRFEHCADGDKLLARRLLAELHDQFRLADSSGPGGPGPGSHEPEDTLDRLYLSHSQIRWEPHEPLASMGEDLDMTLDLYGSKITQISTLEAPLDEGLFSSL
jgi:hypothetical protein